jgi:hypothetical protein
MDKRDVDNGRMPEGARRTVEALYREGAQMAPVLKAAPMSSLRSRAAGVGIPEIPAAPPAVPTFIPAPATQGTPNITMGSPEPPRIPKTRFRVDVEVNEVGFELEVAEVDINERSILLVLEDHNVSVRLPNSEKIKLVFQGVDYPVAFLGNWHKLPSMGVIIVVFTLLERPEALKENLDRSLATA